MKSKILKLTGTDIPDDLKNIPAPPKQLFVAGNLDILLGKPRLAVVGSRKVSPYGRKITDNIVQELASRDVVIISGLALGVDSVAHQAALEAGGLTIAVLPCGLDHIYPASHHNLAKRILSQGGALISEYPPGTAAYKEHFIARNRLVSGMSQGVLITEAAEKSGTLHTANFALEQGRTVFAVPGDIDSPTSKGTNNLIKSGALLIDSVEDIAFGLGLDVDTVKQTNLFGANEQETLILKLIANGITEADQLLAESALPAAMFNQTLTMLEINGKIRPIGAGHWRLK